MNNAWSVALKTPATGRWIANSLQCRSTPITPLSRLVSSLRGNPSSSPSPQICRLVYKRTFSTSPPCERKAPKAPKRAPTNNAYKPLIPTTPPLKTQARQLKPEKTANAPQTRQHVEYVPVPKAQVHLSQAQVVAILGPGLTFDQGMELLQDLQYRRVSGALADVGITFEDKEYITGDHALKALDWLRENHPVDEEAAAIEYTEHEAEMLREQLEARARRLGIYKRDGEEEIIEEEEEEVDLQEPDTSYEQIPIRPDQSQDITGESALLSRKVYVEQAKKVEKAKAEKAVEEAEARGEPAPEAYKGQALVVAKKTAIEDASKLKQERWEQLRIEAELKEEDIFAKRTAFSRLWAPTLLGMTVAGLSWIWADSYEPPKSSMRLFPSISPGTATIATIAVANLGILILWRYPGAWKMMNRYFLLSPGAPNAFSVVGSVFSHQTFAHLWWNMGILYLVGVTVHEEIGRAHFCSLYLTSGIAGSLFSLFVNVLSKSFLSATIGASAAIYGLVGAYFTLTPKRKIGFFGYGETEFGPAWGLIPITAFELYRLRRGWGVVDGIAGGSDHLTHLGGLVAGAISGRVYRKQLEADRAEGENV